MEKEIIHNHFSRPKTVFENYNLDIDDPKHSMREALNIIDAMNVLDDKRKYGEETSC